MNPPYDEAFYARHREGACRSARVVLPLVLEWIHPKRVVDVGCGVGCWLAVLRELGIEDVWGIDGDYVQSHQLLIPPERFMRRDLSQPLHLEETFDLAICLEVAEHLLEACAGRLVDQLCGLAPAVLFSAAIPCSRGQHHVNEQWPAYWTALFASNDFAPYDCLRQKVWCDERVEWWYAQNVLLFIHRTALATHNFGELRHLQTSNPLPLVHPQNYLAANRLLDTIQDPANWSLRRWLSALPRVAWGTFRRKLGCFQIRETGRT